MPNKKPDTDQPLLGSRLPNIQMASIQFAPVPYHEVMDTVLEERVWVWQYWVPKGALVLLSALPKAGKTTFIARLIMHLVTGQPFLGYGVTKTAVLMLAVEEQKYDVYSRFRKLIIPKEAELHIHTGFLHMNDKSMAAIEAFINTHKIGAVVIDTLSHFWPVKDENDNAEVSIHMRRLLELRDKTGVTIILIHHQRKNSGEGIANGTAIRGAGALLASVDQALTLQRTIGGKCRRTLSSIGRYTDTPEEVIIELKDGVYNALGSPQATDDKDAFNRLLTILGAGPKTAAQLSVGSGIDERRVRKLLDIHGGHLGCKGTGERGDPFTWFIK